jgi:hypothetical protein
MPLWRCSAMEFVASSQEEGREEGRKGRKEGRKVP